MKTSKEYEKMLQYLLLTKQEQILMDLLFGKKRTQEDIAILTDGLNPDVANLNYMLMLAYLGQSKGWEFFPKAIIPRLKGIHRYYLVRNSMGIKGLLEQIEYLKSFDIPAILLKGIAMKAVYAPQAPRLMNDMDVLVPKELFSKACSYLRFMGSGTVDYHIFEAHIDNGLASIDLHMSLLKSNNFNEKSIWDNAKKTVFHGTEIQVLSPEDMLIHLVDNHARDIARKECLSRRMKWLYDCRSIVGFGDGVDWEKIAHSSKQWHNEMQVRFMISYFDKVFPGIVPDKFLEKWLEEPIGYNQWLRNAYNYSITSERRLKANEEHDVFAKIRNFPFYLYYEYQYVKPELKQEIHDMNIWKYITYRDPDCNSIFDWLKKTYRNNIQYLKFNGKE